LPPGQLEVVAVSVDTSLAAWQSVVTTQRFGWLNHCSGQGWGDAKARSYGVAGTPGLFLLDRHKKIAGKPWDLAELRSMMQ
jgi:hypothetical protein